jgi:hypothetical protein
MDRPSPVFLPEKVSISIAYEGDQGTHPSRRPIRLGKRIENEVRLVFRNRNPGIRDAELESYALIVERQETGTEGHVSLARHLRRCELDRISDEIGDDLAEAEGVADELIRDIRLNVVCQVQVVLGGTKPYLISCNIFAKNSLSLLFVNSAASLAAVFF